MKNYLIKNLNKNSSYFSINNLKNERNYNNKKIKNIIYNKNIIKDSRIYYFDWLRIISSFSVILIHVCAYYYFHYNINSFIWKISFYYNGISRCGVPNFFMISGALFLNRDLPFEKIINKYIKKMVIHLIFWSFIYSIFNIKNYSKRILKKLLINFIKGHYHLWYLFAIISIYTIIPFLREVTKKEKLLKLFIILSFIFLFIMQNLIYTFFYFSTNLYYLLNELKKKLKLDFFNINYFYFVYGFFLNNKKINNKINRIIIYCLGLLGIFFTTKISYNFAIIKNKKINHFNYIFLNVFFTSTSVFIFFKNNFNNLKINKKFKFIRRISYYTFGIYLIHPLILEILINKFNKLSLSKNIIYLIPLISIFIFMLSLIISILLKFIPFIGKYLI